MDMAVIDGAVADGGVIEDPPAAARRPIVRTGRLAVDLSARAAVVDGARVPLTGKEYAMLELLARLKGETVTKEMFLHHLYGGIHAPQAKIIDVFVCKLRKKLSLACGGDHYIETRWGHGYALRGPHQPAVAA